MYIPRYAEDIVREIHGTFKVLYLGGPRQVGKTTLLLNVAEKLGFNYVTLDDVRERRIAQTDPALFLDQYKAPLLIDEVQYAPELFSYIKIRVDKSDKKGQYWLTGSQQFALLKNLQESLAGRVGIAGLLGLSSAEVHRAKMRTEPFLPSAQYRAFAPLSVEEVYDGIVRGSFPALWQKSPPQGCSFLIKHAFIAKYLL